MAIKLTAESFLNVLRQSGLIAPDLLPRVLEEFRSAGVGMDDSRVIADELVARNRLTRWQAEKLLQGRHKGFFLGKYRLLSLLGKGGMSSVYLAEHVLMRRRCALKVLPTKRVHDSSYLARFHREAQAVAALDHPNIVRAYDVDHELDRDTEIHFLVMEYVDGLSLQEILLQEGPLDYARAADYVRQAAAGLAHAHQAGMVHRDIKPSNLLVDRAGTVKILDLGLARFFQEGEQSLTVAHDEKVLGTADYLAPEQALDSHRVDSRADIYGLGCTFYFLLTAHPPFTEGTLAQRLLCHQNVQPPPITADRPDAPAGLVAIVERMMAKRPDDRYQTADELAADLAGWLAENGGDEWRQKSPAHSSGSGIKARSAPSAKPASASGSNRRAPAPGSSRVTAANATPESAAEPATDRPDEHELAAFLTNLGESDSAIPKPARRQPVPASAPAAEVRANGSPSPAPPIDARKKPRSEVRQECAVGGPHAKNRDVPVAQPVAKPAGAPRPARTVESSPSDVAINGSSAPLGTPGALPEQHDWAAFSVLTDSDSVISSRLKRSSVLRRSGTTEPGSRVARKATRTPALAAVAGALLVALAAWGLWSAFSGPDAQDPKRSEQAPVTGVPGSDPRRLIGREITVGPDGHFQTIGKALEYVIAHFEPESLGARQVIRVSDGTYRERLLVDSTADDLPVPEGIEIIAATGTRPVLAAPGKGAPLIRLNGVRGLVIDGFDLDADGLDIAVEVSSFSSGTTLRNLRIGGFSGTGVVATKAVGGFASGSHEGDVKFENVEFDGTPDSTGARLDSVSRFSVSGSRFHGPLQAGITLAGELSHVSIRQSIFSGPQAGIRFDVLRDVRDVGIDHNTFYRVTRGIEFAQPPTSGHDLRLRRNLFAEVEEFDAALLQGQPGRIVRLMTGEGRRQNWTTRAKPEKPAPRDFDVFSTSGKQGVALTFLSTDRADDQFLVPDATGPAPAFPAAEGELKPFVGARAPQQDAAAQQ